MASKSIFTVPYAYSAELRRRGRRNPETMLLRGTLPVEIVELSGKEAPIRLRARLKHETTRATEMVLRHDGSSYLRPVLASDRKSPKHFSRADLDEMLSLLGSAPALPIDGPHAWLTQGSSRFMEMSAGRPVGPAALDIPTTDEIAPEVKDWMSSADAEAVAQRETAMEADQYVLVGDILHRRTRAPMLAWINSGSWSDTGPQQDPPTPLLLDAVDFENGTSSHKGSGAWWHWWPISQAEAFMAFHPDGGWTLDVHAPLETDFGADVVKVGRTVLQRIDHYLPDALRHLSDDGLDHYRSYRRARLDGLSGDAKAMIAAVDAAMAMAQDSGFAARNSSLDTLASVVTKELPHWDALLRSAGFALDRRDEDAVAALTG